MYLFIYSQYTCITLHRDIKFEPQNSRIGDNKRESMWMLVMVMVMFLLIISVMMMMMISPPCCQIHCSERGLGFGCVTWNMCCQTTVQKRLSNMIGSQVTPINSSLRRSNLDTDEIWWDQSIMIQELDLKPFNSVSHWHLGMDLHHQKPEDWRHPNAVGRWSPAPAQGSPGPCGYRQQHLGWCRGAGKGEGSPWESMGPGSPWLWLRWGFTLWLCQIANWKMAIEIVDLAIGDGDFP